MSSHITSMHYNARYMDSYGTKKLRVLYVLLHVMQTHNIPNEKCFLVSRWTRLCTCGVSKQLSTSMENGCSI